MGLVGRRVAEEADGEAVDGGEDGNGGDFFVGNAKLEAEARDQVVHKDEELEPGVLLSRAHPRAAAERHERERRRPFPFEPRRVELVRLREVRRASVCRRRTPKYLPFRSHVNQNQTLFPVRLFYLISFNIKYKH